MDSSRHYPEKNLVHPEITIKVNSFGFQKQGTQNLLTPEKLTVRRWTQPAKDVHQRRLPGAAVPEQSRDLTFIDVEGQVWSPRQAREKEETLATCLRHPEPAPTAEVNSNTDIWGMHLLSVQRDALPSHPSMARDRWGWDSPCTGCRVAAFKSHTGKRDEKIRETGQGRSYH